MNATGEPLYHVTALSNFARAFDKYSRKYCKGRIPESSYPNESYLLEASELSVGLAKADHLVRKLAIPGDEPLVLQAGLARSQVIPNTRSGVGVVWSSPDLPIASTFGTSPDGTLGPAVSFEDAMARSLNLHANRFASYTALRPRALSLLPISRGCQAACPFCFSEASVSAELRQGGLSLARARQWLRSARSRGAERAVITGGGEPTLLPWKRLVDLVTACGAHFEKTVLITNGVRLAVAPRPMVADQLRELSEAGLSVLAISRHHMQEAVNANLMKFRTMTPALLEAHSALACSGRKLSLRMICVLQRGGVENEDDVQEYINWATSFGVEEVCFKELYVSTSQESVYFSRAANAWSAENQVPLSIVTSWATRAGLNITDRLPWGAPIFSGTFAGRRVRIAAYAEPSLFWERSNGLARSWNVMADGECLASLEDRRSVVELPGEERLH